MSHGPRAAGGSRSQTRGHPCCPALGKKAESHQRAEAPHIRPQEGHGRVGGREGRGPGGAGLGAPATPVRGQTPSRRAGSSTLTDGTEVGKPVLTLLGVDQVVAALLGGRPLQHCFRQAWGGGLRQLAASSPASGPHVPQLSGRGPSWGSPPRAPEAPLSLQGKGEKEFRGECCHSAFSRR